MVKIVLKCGTPWGTVVKDCGKYISRDDANKELDRLATQADRLHFVSRFDNGVKMTHKENRNFTETYTIEEA